ncbi:hypothetical protein [Beijerinckia sp. L45]|uniref:hypothetical protein n=1 Tax=Beijerinckia sp. L45 TaxID=1641855 RepID=UPI0034CF9401
MHKFLKRDYGMAKMALLEQVVQDLGRLVLQLINIDAGIQQQGRADVGLKLYKRQIAVVAARQRGRFGAAKPPERSVEVKGRQLEIKRQSRVDRTTSLDQGFAKMVVDGKVGESIFDQCRISFDACRLFCPINEGWADAACDAPGFIRQQAILCRGIEDGGVSSSAECDHVPTS